MIPRRPAGAADPLDVLDVLDEGMSDERRREAARELVALLGRAREQAGAPRDTPLVALAQASRRLRQITRTADMLAAACEESATLSGLERVVISAPDDRRLVVCAVHGVTAPAAGHDGARPLLDRGEAEAVVLETAAPLVVPPSTADRPDAGRTVGALVGDPHVVVPVVYSDTVIGLLHAGGGSRQGIEEHSVAALSAFASMLSALWYCATIETSWQHHLHALRRTLSQSLEQLTADVPDDLGLLETDEHRPAPVGRPPAGVAGSAHGEPLTPREKVVLKHLLDGAGNREIARTLVLTVDTVKSHVKHILRKTGAANRAELIHLVGRRSTT